MLILLITLAQASPTQAADAACPDAELLSGKLITDICWSCCSVRIAGVPSAG
ncbi:conjugal transfer protein TraU, partial [Lamprobacter modestohalophilus]|nr:conjugal transfer protein TraU [Lamprobacter modestohalophilus]